MSTPIAIVGRACLLPGASTPAALGEMLEAGRIVVSSSPAGRFRLAREHALTPDPRASSDRAWSDLGGYVDPGFSLDPGGLDLGAAGLDAGSLAGLDPLFHWVLHCGREATVGAKLDRRRTGAIFGNLSFPTGRMAERAEATWLAGTPFAPPPVDPRNRFMSGLPAHLLARALGLGGDAFTLDAACASSLYAVALACDALAEGRADAMLAGAVCRADDLFIHVGFCALGAMSRVGKSRPFHAEADGLVPAEGAAMVLLKRLPDALRDGDRVLGVVRSVGLANDGRGRGLVAPSSDGQVRAMRAAYAAAGLSPEDVAYVECHATGTPVGDATEIESLRAVFGGGRALPIGSVKANMGHALAVAGAAGLLKLLHALERGVFLPTPGDGPTIPALADGAFRVVRAVEPWVGPRRAALSAFGFGGNDAHLILEAPRVTTPGEVRPRAPRAKVAVVAMAARVGDGGSTDAFARAIVEGTAPGPRAERVEVPLEGLRTPPRDLDVALAQQTALLTVAAEAASVVPVHGPRAMVVVGMGCDPEIARYGARWRLAEWAAGASPAARAAAQDAFVPALRAEGVLGTMPNIVTNRVNAQLDAAGPSFSVSAEELSGLRALSVAEAALARGAVDVALVGATDFSAEPVHAAALAELGRVARPGDAAVALVLEREDDARRLGHPVLAVLAEPDAEAEVPLILGNAPGARSLSDRVGDAHAATGLVAVAAAVTALGTRVVPSAEVRIEGLFGPTVAVRLDAGDGVARPAALPLRRLSLPAHPPKVVLPEGLAVQRMEPAPTLVPVSASVPRDDEPVPIAAIAVTPRAGSRAAVQAPTPTIASVGLGRVLGEMAALQQRIGAEHQAFLARQAALHEQFLALRAQTTETLLRARPRSPRAFERAAPVREPTAIERPAPVERPAAMERPAPVASPVTPAPAPAAERPAAAVTSTATSARRAPTGPTFDRAALEVHAAGQISSIFGPLFEQQDVHAVQVRMPTPPLLLADRVTGLEGPAGVLGRGVIWTETDVRADAFYMHAGRMTPGVMIESGQADLMLVSWQGIDFLNKGKRAYRLLGCNLTFHGAPPRAGETLAYEIHGDGHANQGDVRLFFFHYDCWIGDRRALSVREGQAGFFTKEELAASAGILWSAANSTPAPGGRVDPPRKTTHRAFEREQLRAFADRGDAHACFGPGFERAATHTRTPAIPGGKLLFLDRVTDFDPTGGPWKRGYLRATQAIRPDDWFFDGHFKNDPCMPGTLMFDGCLSTMAFYLAALGYTLDKDGYRFEPIPELEYKLKCRGQVTPASKELVYEVFVEEVHDGDEPRLFADLLCTVDGLGAFHARRVGLRLVPDWPLTSKGLPDVDDKKVASVDGLPLDYRSLLACAWGQPSTAFGPRYARFDGTRRVPRLPGPPYHYVTRVVSFEGEPFACKPGASVEVEYDVPPDAWYFGEGASEAMPFAVLLEAALQPCGWLASFVGSTLTVDSDLLFRNLDGKGTIFDEVRRDAGVLRTRARIVNVSPASGMLIESFEVECFVGDRLVFKTWSAFGFFPKEALENQVGLPTTDEQRADFDRKSPFLVDLRPEPSRYLRGGARLSAPMLRMIDRVTHFAEDGGKAGLGAVRAEMDVDPHAWFFKAHFFQDPVQPGSLGVEGMRQTLAFAMLELGLDAGIARPRFLPLESKKPGDGVSDTPELVWKYRGQVVPESRTVTITMEIVDRGRDARGAYARATASLWVDGKRIYEAKGLGLRIVEAEGSAEEQLDLDHDAWLRDHCPTFVVPALPMMSVVDRLAGAALAHGASLPLTLRDVQIHRWITVDPSVRLRTEVTPKEDGSLAVTLQLFRHARDPKLSRFEAAASGTVTSGGAPPTPLAALVEPRPTESPYVTGELFHGPAFQLLRARTLGENGAAAVLDAGRGAVPYGTLHQALLDAATHAIPHDRLHLLSDLVGEDKVAYPYRIASLVVHRAPPRTGDVRCEARFVGFDGDERFPTFDLALEADGERIVDLRLVEILMPKGPLGMAAPRARRAFLAERAFVPGLSLSEASPLTTILTDAAVAASDWLPGTLQRLYDLGPTDDRTRDIAVKEHVARAARVHPSQVSLSPEPHAASLPLRRFSVDAARSAEGVTVTDRAPSRLDLGAVQRFWAERFGLEGWPVEDLCFGLARRFCADVHLEDPAAFQAVAGQSVLYLGNHQTGIESILFSVLISALAGTTTMTLAKAEHRDTWLGRMLRHWFSYPGAHDPGVIAHFDRKEAASLLTILEDLSRAMRAEHKSLLVHVEGTRALGCRAPVASMSGTFVDLALALGAPVVPVRFSGGLPVVPGEHRLEFPVGMGKQTYHVGAPILPTELATLTYKARIDRVVTAINTLGGPASEEVPHAPDPTFAAEVDRIAAEGIAPHHAVLRAVLAECPTPCAVTRRILARDLDGLGPERTFAAELSALLFPAR